MWTWKPLLDGIARGGADRPEEEGHAPAGGSSFEFPVDDPDAPGGVLEQLGQLGDLGRAQIPPLHPDEYRGTLGPRVGRSSWPEPEGERFQALDFVPGYRVYPPSMRSAEVASRAGVNVQTLRYYERRGLLAEPDRLASGYRAYGPEAVTIVRFAKAAQGLGFSLEEVGALLELAGGGPRRCEAARKMAAEKIADLNAKIATLLAMRDSLDRLVASCELPRARRECPLLEAIGDGQEGGLSNGL